MQTLLEQPSTEVRIKVKLTEKQYEGFTYLTDPTTNELVYGGGGGGGKSFLLCFWAIFMCLTYQGIRGLIGRESLKGLKESTLLTFFEVCGYLQLEDKKHYIYNQASDTITFVATGSVIYLKELGWLPSDPNYDRLGSTEYTFAAIDEAPQVKQKAKNIVRSRLRFKLGVNNLIPKLLMTCNPSKGYLYTEFYIPNKKLELPHNKIFLKALVTDNQFIDATYIENLRGLDKETQARLLWGNWEYDDDPSALVHVEALQDLFTNHVIGEKPPALGEPAHKKFIIVDVARFGSDRTVFSYWEGMACKRITAYTKLPIVPDPRYPERPSVASKLLEWREQYQVPLSNCLADEDGMGGGVVDYTGCRGFMGGRSPLPTKGIVRNYLNLRSQCSYKLAEVINAGQIAVLNCPPNIRAIIVEELEQIKAKDIDKDDKKLAVISKDEIKAVLGHSPDFSDNLMMRMYYEFASRPTIVNL